jgi:hypothetical protein
MTTARVLQFLPPRVGRNDRAGGREPESPFRIVMNRPVLTPREIVHRQKMLSHLYKEKASG